ncbi:MAG: hypothetical protein JNM67_03150, partial [Bacteroidetes bacterium]|nr:hypothetical protein [Bacteroidota bacterium]
SVEEIKQLNFIRKSAQDLDIFTHELNDFILKTIKNNQIKFMENELKTNLSDANESVSTKVN